MDPVSLILGAASLAGAILGNEKGKTIDPEWLKTHFGAAAVNEQTMELFNKILNSPYGQGVLANASEQAQRFQHETERQAAITGLNGPEGTTGAGIFATSAAQGATDAFQRDARGSFYQMALPIAQQMVQSQMSAYMGDRARTAQPDLMSKIGTAAGQIGAMYTPKTGAKGAATQPTGAFTPNAGGEMPFYSGGGAMRNALQPVLPQTVLRRSARFSPFGGLVQSGGSNG